LATGQERIAQLRAQRPLLEDAFRFYRREARELKAVEQPWKLSNQEAFRSPRALSQPPRSGAAAARGSRTPQCLRLCGGGGCSVGGMGPPRSPPRRAPGLTRAAALEETDVVDDAGTVPCRGFDSDQRPPGGDDDDGADDADNTPCFGYDSEDHVMVEEEV